MSGQILEFAAGKIPQRAIRYLNQLPYFVSYDFLESGAINGVDFGAGDEAFIIKTPSTRRGLPFSVDIYDVTETFNTDTTEARVDIGDGSDADEFALTDDFGALTTALGGATFNVADGTLVAGDTPIVEPGDYVTVTCVAPTGGTPAGIAKVGVTFLYFE